MMDYGGSGSHHVMIDNLNDEVVLDEDSKQDKDAHYEEDDDDECPRYECLQREQVIKE